MTEESSTEVITVRTPEDLLALAPVLMGFHPESSLVMITVGQRGMFHARVDFPARREHLPEIVKMLVEPVQRYAVDGVALIAYTADEALARAAIAQLRRELGRSGARVIEALRADGGRWYPLVRRARAPHGIGYDISGHRFLAHAVLRGRPLRASRDELVASVEPRPERVTAMQARLAELPAGEPVAESAWAVTAVLDAVRRAATSWPDDRAARLLRALSDPTTERAVLGQLTRADADIWADLFTDLVQRAPAGFVAPTAAVLGYAAWLSGNGALAWCAVDRSDSDHPGHGPARQLGLMLMNAVPPHVWDSGWPQDRFSDGA